MNTFGGGMQVHAVPDDERAVDSRGQKLPWGYSYADSTLNRKHPVEKGPFGKSTITNRRSMSRSKTATPSTKDDILRIENNRTIDDIFGRARAQEEEHRIDQTGPRDISQSRKQAVPRSAVPVDLAPNVTVAPAPANISPSRTTQRVSESLAEPTEVMLYGFGLDHQYAAINHFEAASNGHIYEDYDRTPPHPRYTTALSAHRPKIPRTLPQAALRKINTYQGGDHWIKVTFNSPEAAEAACHASPHVIYGYEVRAELWRGIPPVADAAVPAGRLAMGSLAQGRKAFGQPAGNFKTMPGRSQSIPKLFGAPRVQDDQLGDSTSSTETGAGTSTDSTATATGMEVMPGGSDFNIEKRRTVSVPARDVQVEPAMPSASPAKQKPLRIAGATRAQLLPASSALLPVPPWTQRTFGHLPLVGQLFGGPSKGNVIGVSIPRKENGEFDWDVASLYWRICFTMDSWLGTDLCGLRSED